MRKLFAAAAVTLVALAPVAHADQVKCHCSPGLALWCEDLDTGQAWQAAPYNSKECGGSA
jgi:hypothetical protein